MRAAPAVLLAVLAMLAMPFGVASAAVSFQISDHGRPAADVAVVLDPLDAAPAPAAAQATIDQVNKQFVPRVSVVRTGTSVDFPNSDQIRHQVYSFSPAKTFQLKLYGGRTAPPVVFDKPGLVVLGCNIHDSMVAFVLVVDTPYFGRSDANGFVRIAAPPGRYRLRVWHPELERPIAAREVLIHAEEPVIALDAPRRSDREDVAPWTD